MSVVTDNSATSGTGELASDDFVQSFARGLAVIRAFDAEHPELSLAEVARRAGLPRAAARRFLRTLEVLGYVRSDGRRFALTPRVLDLGFSYLSSIALPDLMQPHLEALSRDVDDSVSAGVLDVGDVVYIARVPTRRIMSVGITIGTRFPAFATSLGRVLLAGLGADARAAALASRPPSRLTSRTITAPAELAAAIDTVAAQGWALIDGELEIGVRSIAAPVHGRDGTVVAAINLSMASSIGPVDEVVAERVPRLLATAAAIDAELRLR